MAFGPGIDTTLNYAGSAPAIVAGTSARAIVQGAEVIEAAGLRIGAKATLDEALDRLGKQATSSIVWIEIDELTGGESVLNALLDQVQADVGDGRYGAVIATSEEGSIDRLGAIAFERGVEILVAPSESDRAAALALALHRDSFPQSVSDVSSSRSSAQLRQLSDEVNRIAATLARLSTGTTAPAAGLQPGAPSGVEATPVAAETVRSVIRARRLRNRFFPEDLFADPAWDMLLDLLQAELAHLRVPVSSLCIAAAVPATTALRWLKAMVDRGLFVRRADPFDGRRVFVELAPDTSRALHHYFAEVERVAAV